MKNKFWLWGWGRTKTQYFDFWGRNSWFKTIYTLLKPILCFKSLFTLFHNFTSFFKFGLKYWNFMHAFQGGKLVLKFRMGNRNIYGQAWKKCSGRVACHLETLSHSGTLLWKFRNFFNLLILQPRRLEYFLCLSLGGKKASLTLHSSPLKLWE